jgi:predicted dehydrogenase
LSGRARLRLALVGAGRWGQNYIKTLLYASDAHLAYVVSRNPDTKSRVPDGCQVLPDWRLLLSQKIDGVIIATPPQSHAEIALAFMKQQTPVLLEKPLTMDLASSQCVLQAAQQQPSCVMIDHIYVYHPAFCQMLALIKQSDERIVSIEAVGGNDGPVRPDVSVLWDWGSHDIAMSLALIGACPDDVVIGDHDLLAPNRGQIKFKLHWSDGAVASIHIGNTFTEKKRYVRVKTTHKTYLFDDLATAKLSVQEGQDRAFHAIAVPSSQSPLGVVVSAFAKRIIAADTSLADVMLGHDVVHVLSHAAFSPISRPACYH